MSTELKSMGDILKRMQERTSYQEPNDPIAEVEELARLLSEVAGFSVDIDERFQDGRTPIGRRFWLQAVAAYAFLKGIDPEYMVEETASPSPR